MSKTKHNIAIPNDIKLINDVFKQNGYKLFLIGGCIRDSLLDINPKDWDLVSELLPDKVIDLLNDKPFVKNILLTGKAFGVINVITNDGEYEIATFRSDGEYNDSRRPDTVIFGNIVDDSARRDFRINSLYYDIETNEIIDLVGGLEDLRLKVIRTVGKPKDRFKEDRLRILRFCRFYGRFDSDLDPEIDEVLKNDSSLEGISSERIRDEFMKGISSAKSVKKFLSIIDKYELFNWIFSGLTIDKNDIEDKDPIIVIAALLKNNAVSELGKRLNNLKYTVEELRAITFLIGLLKLSIDTAVNLKRAQKNAGITHQQIKIFGNREGIDNTLLDAFIKFELTVNGQEVMDTQNIKAGPELGKTIHNMETNNFKKLLTE